MTLPLFLLDPGRASAARVGGPVVLDGAEGRHAVTVRRIGVGERVLLTDGRGRVLEVEVTGTEPTVLTSRVLAARSEPEPRPRFVLVQALAKGGRDEDAIEASTELGVDEVVPWQAARSIVRWRGEKATKALAKWESVVVAAAKQSRRARVPVVSPAVTTAEVTARCRPGALVLVLHEDASERLSELRTDDLDRVDEIDLVVGPEGGIGPEELEALAAAGARPVRLGPTVLRTSTAGPAALAVLASRVRW